MLTPFLLHRCYTEQNVNCFKIGCFSFEERLGVHMKITQAAHNRRKIVGATSGDLGLGGGCQSTLSGGGFLLRQNANWFSCPKL